MSSKKHRLLKRRITGACLSSAVSVTLVLVIVGGAVLLLLGTGSIGNYLKDSVKVTVLLKSGTSDDAALKLQEDVNALGFVKSSRYVDQAEGLAEMEEMLGKDFADVFQTSPVPTSIEVSLKSEYVNADSLQTVKQRLGQYRAVEMVHCPVDLARTLSDNLVKLGAALSLVVLLLLVSAIALISNMVRLMVYSRRHIIHTMQLVGASDQYIAGPYILRACLLGAVSALCACVPLLYLRDKFSVEVLCQTAGAVFAAGLLICMLSTWVFVIKYINSDSEELYG